MDLERLELPLLQSALRQLQLSRFQVIKVASGNSGKLRAWIEKFKVVSNNMLVVLRKSGQSI